MREGYPLQWPEHWDKTPNHKRQRALFDTTFAKARDDLLNEIRLLGGKYAVISSNIPLKNDGYPYASYKEPEEPGVAVYFELYGEEQCIPCDKWNKTEDNLQAINKTVKALRGIERWGAEDMVKASFKGFKALPPPDGTMPMGELITPWHEVLGIIPNADKSEIRKAYKRKAKQTHPDRGGSIEEFQEVQQAFNKGMKEATR